MLETYSGLKPEDLGNMTKRNYTSLLNNVSNIKNFNVGGKLQLETHEDKIARRKKEIQERLNNGEKKIN